MLWLYVTRTLNTIFAVTTPLKLRKQNQIATDESSVAIVMRNAHTAHDLRCLDTSETEKTKSEIRFSTVDRKKFATHAICHISNCHAYYSICRYAYNAPPPHVSMLQKRLVCWRCEIHVFRATPLFGHTIVGNIELRGRGGSSCLVMQCQ